MELCFNLAWSSDIRLFPGWTESRCWFVLSLVVFELNLDWFIGLGLEDRWLRKVTEPCPNLVEDDVWCKFGEMEDWFSFLGVKGIGYDPTLRCVSESAGELYFLENWDFSPIAKLPCTPGTIWTGVVTFGVSYISSGLKEGERLSCVGLWIGVLDRGW